MKKTLGIALIGSMAFVVGKMYYDHEYEINRAMKKMIKENTCILKQLKNKII